MDRDTFEEISRRQPSGFLEWAQVHGNLYGTSRDEVEQHLKRGHDVILDIDVQGAMQVMEAAEPVTVFITPPSLEELEKRLRRRGTENEGDLALRLENAQKELQKMDRYDYLIVNDELQQAVEGLRSVIISERCRRRRAWDGSPLDIPSLRV